MPCEGVMRKKLETEIWLGSKKGRREGRKQPSIPLCDRANYRIKPTLTHIPLPRLTLSTAEVSTKVVVEKRLSAARNRSKSSSGHLRSIELYTIPCSRGHSRCPHEC